MSQERRRIDADGVTLMWGDPAASKAELRAESVRAHVARPIAERLLAALAMVLPRESESVAELDDEALVRRLLDK